MGNGTNLKYPGLERELTGIVRDLIAAYRHRRGSYSPEVEIETRRRSDNSRNESKPLTISLKKKNDTAPDIQFSLSKRQRESLESARYITNGRTLRLTDRAFSAFGDEFLARKAFLQLSILTPKMHLVTLGNDA